jgi:hypothetical protein
MRTETIRIGEAAALARGSAYDAYRLSIQDPPPYHLRDILSLFRLMGRPDSKEPVEKSSKMKLLAFVSFLVLVVAIVANHVQVPFLNSVDITVNEIPPEVRLYWMKQANRALYNYSGPW